MYDSITSGLTRVKLAAAVMAAASSTSYAQSSSEEPRVLEEVIVSAGSLPAIGIPFYRR